jgi:Sec-independent protein translocase protein TatA
MSEPEADAAPPAATVAAVAPPGSSASTSSGSGSAGIAALLADIPVPPGGEQLGDAITRLKREQDDVRANRKRVTKELKNAQKRKQRLKKRAKQLSDTDLVSVLQLRASEKPVVAAAAE